MWFVLQPRAKAISLKKIRIVGYVARTAETRIYRSVNWKGSGQSRGLWIILKGKAVPLQAWTDPEGSRKLRLPDFVTKAQDGGKVVNLTHRPSLPPGNTPGTHFCWRLSRPQCHSAIGRIMSMNNLLTLAGIEPATFRFVAQHLSHCATAVSYKKC